MERIGEQRVHSADIFPSPEFKAGEAGVRACASSPNVVVKLDRRIKTALDETRLLILGSQVLFGFLFAGAFQDGFKAQMFPWA